jgi:hypothetical protein
VSWLKMHPSGLHGAHTGGAGRPGPVRAVPVLGGAWSVLVVLRGVRAQLRSRLVEVRDLLLEHAGELTFAEDKQLVQARVSYAIDTSCPY